MEVSRSASTAINVYIGQKFTVMGVELTKSYCPDNQALACSQCGQGKRRHWHIWKGDLRGTRRSLVDDDGTVLTVKVACSPVCYILTIRQLSGLVA